MTARADVVRGLGDRRTTGTAIGALRTAVGAALVLAPGRAGRIWVGPGGSGPGERVFARVVGARDVALGLATVRAARSGGADVVGLLRFGVVADVADALATVAADRQLVRWRRVVMPLLAGAVAVAGALLVRSASSASREPAPSPGAAAEAEVGAAAAAPVDGPPQQMAPLPGTAGTPPGAPV